MTQLPTPMPRKLVMGFENTGKLGGMTPCGPAGSPCERATCNLSKTHRYFGFHCQASGSSVGIQTSSGHAMFSKYWWRQGAGSKMGKASLGYYQHVGRSCPARY